MKKKLLSGFLILLALAAAVLLLYTIFISKDITAKNIITCIALFASCIRAAIRINSPDAPTSLKVYEKAYADIIEGVFADDPDSYKKLLKATMHYNKEHFSKAHKMLDELLGACRTPKDYAAVYLFHALCFSDSGDPENAIEAYRKLLQYDNSNSRAWSNMGLCYVTVGKINDAEQAYLSALRFDPDNAQAYNNLSNCYIQKADPQTALKHALKALELNSRMHQAMSAAAIAYKMLGDSINADKYCTLYGINTGDNSKLKMILESIEPIENE